MNIIMLHCYCNFNEMIVTTLDNIWCDNLTRHDDIPSGSIHTFLRQMHPEFLLSNKPHLHIVLAPLGGMCFKHTSIWMRLWGGIFKPRPFITPMFTAHLDIYRVSRTTFGGLETQVNNLKTDLTMLSTAMNHFNGECGHHRNHNAIPNTTPGTVPG
jgi:hypothetical protein